MENIGYYNLLAGTYSHPLLKDTVRGLASTGMILNAGIIGLSIYKIIKRDKAKDPLRGYIIPILAGIVGCVGYSIYFMKKNGQGFYPVELAYRALVWLSAIGVFGSVATAQSSRAITTGHVAVYIGYFLLAVNVICGIVFEKMPINYYSIMEGNYTLDELRRYADLAQYITNANWVFLAVFLFLFIRYYSHFKANGLLVGIITYVIISIVSLITDTGTVYADSRNASVSGVKAILVVNFIFVDVISVAQMVISITLCKKWVIGKPLPDVNDTEMAGENQNQSQMSNITNPFAD
ncbi:hypothetical protein K501DRAFT_308906 [Backusella circina FSU 941]|nr:hypothetical protein K501DRAFT_308906 [Backusella circina FSU 941]